MAFPGIVNINERFVCDSDAYQKETAWPSVAAITGKHCQELFIGYAKIAKL
jgi:hypothetical protein